MRIRSRIAATAAVALFSNASIAVSLSPEGVGQALIFPYYTANSAGGNAFNTYLSIVNHAADAKALRVRFREGRNGRETLAFNLYLSPRDVWTGAVVPFETGARLLSSDVSCTDPALQVQSGTSFLPFTAAAFSASNEDGAGTDTQRVREGFVEVLEMAVLTGANATAVTHAAQGVPANCAFMRASTSPSLAAPTGGLSGTLTLINVASGLDFTVNAEALADLASRPYFRPPTDAYPDLNAAEIDAVSDIAANGSNFRSRWSRPVDAVSAALMRAEWLAEFVLDAGTQSLTDIVVTFPTRQFYTTSSITQPPFTMPSSWSFDCGGRAPSNPQADLRGVSIVQHNREARFADSPGSDFPEFAAPRPLLCATSAVLSARNQAAHMPAATRPTAVLGSDTAGISGGFIELTPTFVSGWLRFIAPTPAAMTSDASSVRWNASGSLVPGAHRVSGQPVVGFAVRTFRNGTLSCAGATCQGNYGGAFPLKYLRSIAAAP